RQHPQRTAVPRARRAEALAKIGVLYGRSRSVSPLSDRVRSRCHVGRVFIIGAAARRRHRPRTPYLRTHTHANRTAGAGHARPQRHREQWRPAPQGYLLKNRLAKRRWRWSPTRLAARTGSARAAPLTRCSPRSLTVRPRTRCWRSANAVSAATTRPQSVSNGLSPSIRLRPSGAAISRRFTRGSV